MAHAQRSRRRRRQERAPTVAFIVAGEVRPSPSLLGESDPARATTAFLESYRHAVLLPHGGAPSSSAVFLLLNASVCGPQCERFTSNGSRCVQVPPASCDALLGAAESISPKPAGECFRGGTGPQMIKAALRALGQNGSSLAAVLGHSCFRPPEGYPKASCPSCATRKRTAEGGSAEGRAS